MTTLHDQTWSTAEVATMCQRTMQTTHRHWVAIDGRRPGKGVRIRWTARQVAEALVLSAILGPETTGRRRDHDYAFHLPLASLAAEAGLVAGCEWALRDDDQVRAFADTADLHAYLSSPLRGPVVTLVHLPTVLAPLYASMA